MVNGNNGNSLYVCDYSATSLLAPPTDPCYSAYCSRQADLSLSSEHLTVVTA